MYERWKDRPRAIEGVVTVVGCTLFLRQFPKYCEDVIEKRIGVPLADPVLSRLPAIDFTWPTFIVLYAALVSGLVLLSMRPTRACAGLQAYTLMIAFRWMGLYLVPIEPPAGMIILHDPVIQLFGPTITLTRDLFFSGHTGTMCMLFLTATTRWTRLAYLLGAIIIAAFVTFQRVHYAFDVFAAPAFALLAWRLVLWARKQAGLPDATLDVSS